MAQVIWTEPALQELDEIADYISLDNPTAAKKLVQKIFGRVDQLIQHPKSGKSVEELQVSVYRKIVVSPCKIFYREDEDQNIVYVIHVIRDGQLLHIDTLTSR